MPIGTIDSIILIGTVAICTLVTRAFPFILFGTAKEPPSMVRYIGTVLPYAVISILIVYCLRNISFEKASGFLPEIIAVIIVGLLHVWKRNNLLSIGLGTTSYMIMVQLIFI